MIGCVRGGSVWVQFSGVEEIQALLKYVEKSMRGQVLGCPSTDNALKKKRETRSGAGNGGKNGVKIFFSKMEEISVSFCAHGKEPVKRLK